MSLLLSLASTVVIFSAWWFELEPIYPEVMVIVQEEERVCVWEFVSTPSFQASPFPGDTVQFVNHLLICGNDVHPLR